jgi:hypothetical protein
MNFHLADIGKQVLFHLDDLFYNMLIINLLYRMI